MHGVLSADVMESKTLHVMCFMSLYTISPWWIRLHANNITPMCIGKKMSLET